MKTHDRFNMKEFKEMGNRGRYICSNCGNVTTLADSESVEGKHLICTSCIYKIANILNTDRSVISIMLHKN